MYEHPRFLHSRLEFAKFYSFTKHEFTRTNVSVISTIDIDLP